MEKVTENLDSQLLKHLRCNLNDLIGEYEHAYKLLDDQMQAVINHDISSLNQLIEKQVALYDALKESENQFKEQLQLFYHHSSVSSSKHTLSKVLENLKEPSQTLKELRDRLHKQVEKTEKLRTQLLDLLQFAQEQNNETFRALYELASENAESYDAHGEKQPQTVHALAINQKA